MKLSKILLTAVGTTAVALFSSFLLLPENSGYFGLFLIGVSPLFVVIFIVWNYILNFLVSVKPFFRHFISKFLLTFLFAYFVTILSSYFIASDSYGYDFSDFKDDTLDILQEFSVFICVIMTTAAHSILVYFADQKNAEK